MFLRRPKVNALACVNAFLAQTQASLFPLKNAYRQLCSQALQLHQFVA